MALELLSGPGKLMDAKGDYELKPTEHEYIGLYFSAHWCPPCRGFTPQLAEYYKAINTGDKVKFQVVFVSSDRDESGFKEYFGEMPWVALKFGYKDKEADKDTKAKLAKEYNVQGIPKLVILDSKGNTVTEDGRGCVSKQMESGKPELKWT